MASIFTSAISMHQNWAKASGNCFAAHWATSAKGGATSMVPATWNHGKNHGSHGTKARILATGVIFKDLPTSFQVEKPPTWQIWIIYVYMHMIICIQYIVWSERFSLAGCCWFHMHMSFRSWLFPLRLAKMWSRHLISPVVDIYQSMNLCIH